MQKIFNIVIVALIGIIFTMLYLSNQTPKFGSTITTINGSDKIADSRTVINTNFTNLLNGKFELSDWFATTSAKQLVSLGTLTTGIWNASAITALYGGTGSTTLSSNQLLIGNGTGIVKTVNGFGTSGQFLTSNGSALAPTWTTSAIDQSANYTWTGQHFFNGASTTIAILATATTTQFGIYGGIAPVGSMLAYASTTAPVGWLLCDGSSLLRTAYPQLFQVIGIAYGSADGTHFTLPNLSGRTPVMASTTANIGQTGGEDLHTITQAQIPNYNLVFPGSNAGAVSGGAGEYTTSGSTNIPSGGSGTAMNVRDPYLAVQYIIKY